MRPTASTGRATRSRPRGVSPAGRPSPLAVRLLKTRRLYDHAAANYGHSRKLWLAAAGQAAESQLLSDLATTLRPGMRVLDAGSGTGALSRHIKSLCPEVSLTMADLSPAMIAEAADVDAVAVITDVEHLPFADESFDLVVSSWTIETVPHPKGAVSEYLRVLTQQGQVFYTFCSRPTSTTQRLLTLPLRTFVRVGYAGHFLTRPRTPWHDCLNSHRFEFHGGLATEIGLAKCCFVEG